MANVADWLKIDSERITASLQDIAAKLDSAEGEIVLDFASVRRIDSPALALLQVISESAKCKGVKLTLRAVNVDIYKVLLLAGITSRVAVLN
ncbi:MAG: STAS domain-containing protein [Terriglobales bacterium]